MATILKRQFIKEVRASGAIEPFAKKEVKKQFDQAKANLLREFDEHPVTVEIEAGSGAENLSGTLVGKGNLFGFIGFRSSDTPIAAVRNLLNSISFKNTKNGQGLTYEYKIDEPSQEEIKAATPMPWLSGRSWIAGIESGISGLSRFLTRKSLATSRSGVAIQTDKPINKASFKPRSYLSGILDRFRKSFE